MAYTIPYLDENGHTVLDEYNLGLDVASRHTRRLTTGSNHVAFAGTGLPNGCCHVSISDPEVNTDYQGSTTGHWGGAEYPSPQQAISDTPYFSHDAQLRRDRLMQVVPDDHNSANSLEPTSVQAGKHGCANEGRAPSVGNSPFGVIADEQRARDTQAAFLAARALQASTHNGQYLARGNRTADYPFTAPETFPSTNLQWIIESGYNPGVGSSKIKRTAGAGRGPNDQHAPAAVLPGGTHSITTHTSTDKPFECTHRPCKLNGKVATFKTANDRNKHEQRVHSPEETRPYHCNICQKRFNHPREVGRHFDTSHSQVPSTARCHLCPRTFKHRMDGLDRHLKGFHKLDEKAIMRCREARAGSSSSIGSSHQLTPSTTPGLTSNDHGLLTPPPSRDSYSSEFSPLASPATPGSSRRFNTSLPKK